MSLPWLRNWPQLAGLGHQGAATDSSTLLILEEVLEKPQSGCSGSGFALLECGCDLSLSLTLRLMMFWKTAQCRDALWTHRL